MAKQAEEPCEVKCPIYDLIQCVCGKHKAGSKVMEHLNSAKVEVLMAVRSVIDARIDELQKKASPSGGSRRIKVTGKE